LEDKLNILISQLEEEKQRLTASMQQFLNEGEFLMAHYQSEALQKLSMKIQAVNNFADKLYDEKVYTKRRIESYKKIQQVQETSLPKEYYDKKIETEILKLEKLNQVPIEETSMKESHLLKETLTDLMEKKIKSFRLILKKNSNFYLDLQMIKKNLVVLFPFTKLSNNDFIWYEEKLRTLENLGFQLNQNKLILHLNGTQEEIINKLMQILSKIVFDVFYFKTFENESYIQIKNKMPKI
jgi:hypothetical protein